MKVKNSFGLCCILFFLFVFFVSLSHSQKVYAEIFISENWDGTPPTYWPCKQCSGSYCGSGGTWNGWEAGDYVCSSSASSSERAAIASSGQVTDFGYTNKTSYYQEMRAGNKRACDLVFPIYTPRPTKIYLRVYLYFAVGSPGMAGFDTSDGLIHFIFTNSARSGTGLRINIDHRTSKIRDYPNGCYFTWEDGSTTISQQPDAAWDIRDHIGEWIYFEVMADASNDRVSMWVKGASDESIITLWENQSTNISQSNFSSIIISGWNNLGDHSGSFYVDELKVSDSYIGTIEPSAEPSAPKNLRIEP